MTGNGSVQREYPSTVKRVAITFTRQRLGTHWSQVLNTSGEAR